jgi:Tfp pilus assembly protein PilF
LDVTQDGKGEKMQRLLLALSMIVLMAGSAAAHGSISKLPDSVQILQYKMKLYMNEDDADTKNNLAMVYVRTGQLSKAREQLTAILAQDPHNFNALDEMGVVLLIEGKADNALEYLKKALAINDKDMMLHVHFSVAYNLLQQTELAGREMNQAKIMSSGPEELKGIEAEIQLLTQAPGTGKIE